MEKIENRRNNQEIREAPEKFVRSIEIRSVEKRNPSRIMKLLKGIRDAFRPAIVSGESSPGPLIKKMQEELSTAEKEATRNGVNFAKCQMDKIVEAYKQGRQVEFETLSPYLSDYGTSTGEIWADNLTEADAIGLALSRALRDSFSSCQNDLAL